jgi:hypothetical protein
MGSAPFMKDYLQCQTISINIAYVTGHNLVEERFQKRDSTFTACPTSNEDPLQCCFRRRDSMVRRHLGFSKSSYLLGRLV